MREETTSSGSDTTDRQAGAEPPGADAAGAGEGAGWPVTVEPTKPAGNPDRASAPAADTSTGARAAARGHDGPSKPSGSSGSSGQGPGANKALVRRVAGKAAEVGAADERTVAVAAHLVGSSTSLADLTTAVMTSSRSAASAVHDVGAIAASDEMEAGVAAAAMGRDRVKAVWSLLAVLGAVSTSGPPGSDAKAALAIVRAVFALADDDRAVLSDAQRLLRKS